MEFSGPLVGVSYLKGVVFAGLDPYHDTIIEIACLITDGNLEQTLEVSLHCTSSHRLQLQIDSGRCTMLYCLVQLTNGYNDS